MSWAERYRRNAAECVRLAQQTTDPTDKALLLQMASGWIRLAERAEARKSSDDLDDDGEDSS